MGNFNQYPACGRIIWACIIPQWAVPGVLLAIIPKGRESSMGWCQVMLETIQVLGLNCSISAGVYLWVL